jgi:hypothetical protein
MRMKIYPAADVFHVYLDERLEKPHAISAFRDLCFDRNQNDENASEWLDVKSGKFPEYALSCWEKRCRLVYSTEENVTLLSGKCAAQV